MQRETTHIQSHSIPLGGERKHNRSNYQIISCVSSTALKKNRKSRLVKRLLTKFAYCINLLDVRSYNHENCWPGMVGNGSKRSKNSKWMK